MTTPSPGETVPPLNPPPLPGPVWLSQTWRDMVFIHWPVAPASVQGLFPDQTRPDTFDGETYVGIVGFGISSTRLGGAVELGSMYELNVRLYSVDRQGRQGVVFLSMDLTRPDIVLAARVLLQLPYLWSHLQPIRPAPRVAGFRLRRRLSGVRADIGVDAGEPVVQPTELEVFLTSRWGLHAHTVLGTTWIPIAHPPLPLHRARLRHADQALLTAPGVPAPIQAPVGVLWSPGADVQVGRPARVRQAANG